MFSKYYLSELSYLRDLGQSFSQTNPSIAGHLAERGGDPDVARLLEGFAFLTARIRERVDDAVPEVTHGLTELLLPQYLRPVPASAIVEFSPQTKTLRGRHRVPEGTQLASVPVDGTACTFRTTTDVDLLPITLAGTTLDNSSATTPKIRTQLQTTAPGLAEVLKANQLRFFIHAEISVASLVAYWLQRHLKSLSVRDVSKNTPPTRLPPQALQFIGSTLPLLPWPKSGSAAYRSVQELFTLPQKFMFFDLQNFAAAAQAFGERSELIFEFDRPPPLPARFGEDLFKLHCVPVINLFRVDADPIRRDPLAHESLLRATNIDPNHMEVHSVESVTGIHSGRGGRTNYPPFFTYAHSAAAPEKAAYHRIRRELSPINDGIDTYLLVDTPIRVAPDLTEETLSIELWCTNRSLPSRLAVGDIRMPTPSSPNVATFKNITPVTKPLRPPLGSELHWRLLSHVSLNQRSLGDAEALRSVLSHYNFQAFADHPVGRANQLRVDAIHKVQMSPVRRLMDRTPLRGMRTVVSLEESNFAGLGDAFLFGCVLDDVFAQNVTINAFNELVIRLEPSQQELTWTARSGSQPIL